METLENPRKFRKGQPARLAAVLLFGLIMNGCDPYVIELTRTSFARLSVPETETSRKFNMLCRSEAGTKIYDKASDVRGILVASSSEFGCSYCERGLLEAGYEFVEYEVTDAVLPGSRRRIYATENGLYRYTLEEAGHPNCQLFYEFYEPWQKAGGKIPPKYKGRCIAARRVTAPLAKLKIKHVRIPEEYSQEQDRIRESKLIYVNLDESKIYARHNSFSYRAISDHQSISGVGFSYACPTTDDVDFRRPKPETIFRPKGYNLQNSEILIR